MSKKHWTNVEDISAYLHVLLVPDIEYQRQWVQKDPLHAKDIQFLDFTVIKEKHQILGEQHNSM
jgi:hypothetical protein